MKKLTMTFQDRKGGVTVKKATPKSTPRKEEEDKEAQKPKGGK